MKQVELLFIPSPGLSHLIATVEAARLLLSREGRLSITVLIMKLPNDTSVVRYMQSGLDTLPPRLRLLDLPALDSPPAPSRGVPLDFIDMQYTNVRDAMLNLTMRQYSSACSDVGGVVLDIFCTKFMDIARELHLPCYVFLTSCVSGLSLTQHLEALRSEQNQDLSQYQNSDVEFSLPTFRASIPAKVFPAETIAAGSEHFLRCFKRAREAKGIMANTFYYLESYAIDSLLSSDGDGDTDTYTPKIYPVGPILMSQSTQLFDDGVKKWLDEQPEKSVVFLCFGSMGSLVEAQVREFAMALENSGFRFLWSMRDGGALLPEGFVERTKGVGKVIGWAAQVAVLAHAAVGGFVSHCGWNSILESVWFGVPIATFPLYAEQQMNAFHLVKELGMAEMITLDYRMGPAPQIVGWEEIAAAVKRLMAAEGVVRKKVEEMQKKARAAVVEGGSSYMAQTLFIQHVIENISM